MGRLKVLDEPVSGVERLLEMAKLAGIENLQAVLGCTFTFDRGYFEQVIDALVEMHAEGRDGLRGVPIDVVCDHRHYRGHGIGMSIVSRGALTTAEKLASTITCSSIGISCDEACPQDTRAADVDNHTKVSKTHCWSTHTKVGLGSSGEDDGLDSTTCIGGFYHER